MIAHALAHRATQGYVLLAAVLLLTACDAEPLPTLPPTATSTPAPVMTPASPTATANATPTLTSTPTLVPSATPTLTPSSLITLIADPPTGVAPLYVNFHLMVKGVYVPVCGADPQYDFGDGTKFGVPAPSCAVAPRTPVPTPTPMPVKEFGIYHRYEQAGTYQVIAGVPGIPGYLRAETTVVVR